MKKVTFILALLMVTALAIGQEIVTDFWHENGLYFNFHNIVETSDNCLIAECPMFEQALIGPDIGVMFYKFSKEGAVMDSLLLWNDDIQRRTLFERDPDNPDSYVFALFERADNTLFFRMKTIDKDLNLVGETVLEIDSTSELSDFRFYDFFIEPGGDIIASYSLKDDPNETFMTHFLRIGFDGTLKDRKEVPEIRYFNKLLSMHTGIYSLSPMRYCYWGSNRSSNNNDNPPIRLYVLDSQFNVVDEQRLYSYNGSIYTANWQEHFAPLDSQHYLNVNTHSWLDPNYYTKRTVLLEKRNQNHEIEAATLFGETVLQPAPIRAIAVDSNTIYLSYMTAVMENNNLVLLRLDGDLNVVWERHFLSNNMFHWATCMEVLQDGSIAIGSFQYETTPGSVSVVVFQDNYDDLEEQGIIVRPYAYYPNPVQDELHLQYSPDVTPTQIELYDLQGRLVRTQKNDLERLEMNGLPVGTYTMRVTLKDGKVFADKVVKE